MSLALEVLNSLKEIKDPGPSKKFSNLVVQLTRKYTNKQELSDVLLDLISFVALTEIKADKAMVKYLQDILDTKED